MALVSWYSAQRGDNLATTDPKYAPSNERKSPDYGYYRTEGYIFSPEAPQPAGTVALVSWYSAQRGDNLATTDPKYAPSNERKSPDYGYYRTEGYIFSPDAPQPAGTVALVSWYSAQRGDNLATTDPQYAASNERKSPDYGYYRTEGYVFSPEAPQP